MEFKCEDCGTFSSVHSYTQKVSETSKVYKVLCPKCAKVHIDKGEDLRLFGSDVSAENSNSKTDIDNNNSTTTAAKSVVETTDTNSSKLFDGLAVVIAGIGFTLGIILGFAFPVLDYYDDEAFNFGLMIGTWAGTAVLSISLWAVRCILNYQEKIIKNQKSILEELKK